MELDNNRPAVTQGDDDTSPQAYIRISERTITRIRVLAREEPAITPEAIGAQVLTLIRLLRTFDDIRDWPIQSLVPLETLEEMEDQRDVQAARANRLADNLRRMSTIAERLALLENPVAPPRVKPVEVKAPEPYEGSCVDL
jgi:hypothetical protein